VPSPTVSVVDRRTAVSKARLEVPL